MTGKSVKDVDRYQAVLANLLLEEDNKFCADCQSKGSVYSAAGRTSSSLRKRLGGSLFGERGFWRLGRPNRHEW